MPPKKSVTDRQTDRLTNRQTHRAQTINIIGTNLLTKFHEDRKINKASRVLTRKNAPPPWQPYIIGMNLLTKFHEDRTVNVASRVLTRLYYSHIRKMPRPLEYKEVKLQLMKSHVFQANIIIFKLIQDIIETNFLTKFHEDWIINVDSTVLTSKNAPPPNGHVFKATKTIFKLIQDIFGTNLLTKFHDDRKINVTSRVLTRKKAPPPIIFVLVQYIIGMNLLTEFHEDRTINVASRVHIWKNAPPLGNHVFQANITIFKFIQDINKKNLLTKFHEDYTYMLYYSHIWKNAPPLGDHVLKPTGISCYLFQDIIGMNLLNKFHKDRTINVVSRVLTRFNYSHIRKKAPPFGSHVFQAKVTIFVLIQDIIGTNLLSKFHEDRKINVASRKTAPPPGGHIIETNVLTKFHDDWAIIVTSRVNTAPHPGCHTNILTNYKLSRGINRTNVLTKFHEDQTINVASGVFTRQTVDDARRTTHDGQKAITKAHHEHGFELANSHILIGNKLVYRQTNQKTDQHPSKQ
ncbi:hypothetical protein DPMN_087225 [Dreissena polymorpha]|uniref:Uncharacterized protein n=1 Tax=Dreissena polymorpha TaxID=45954 RepID=A0A9D4KRU9_DREPO|nr:hypothetical protein DPMN_087225 [Dreissena polymorpha]